MLWGYTAMLSVTYATLLAAALSFLRKDTALTPRRLWKALEEGATGVLSVASTCATAGVIVGVVTLTGLGLMFSLIILGLAGNNLFLTAAYTGVALWILGLAVPVTASYIIAAVITATAMAGLTGWLRRKTTLLEQALLIGAGLVLVYPGWLQDLIGFSLFILALLLQTLRRTRSGLASTPG
jgi:TRAP-type uncharacterized transport system fused permease subunit